MDKLSKIWSAQLKNEKLINDLIIKRASFATIGTNKAKRRLNKLASLCPIAKAIRLALEIEDKNISAKNYWNYKDKIYQQKHDLIIELCELFKQNNWIYGTQKSDVYGVSHVAYFEIPECEQISWHLDIGNRKDLPPYKGEWDKKENSTLNKLEKVAKQLLEDAKLI